MGYYIGKRIEDVNLWAGAGQDVFCRFPMDVRCECVIWQRRGKVVLTKCVREDLLRSDWRLHYKEYRLCESVVMGRTGGVPDVSQWMPV